MTRFWTPSPSISTLPSLTALIVMRASGVPPTPAGGWIMELDPV